MEYKKIKPHTYWERMLLENLKEIWKDYELIEDENSPD